VTVFLTVAGNYLFVSDVEETSECTETSCIVLYNTAPTWLHMFWIISLYCMISNEVIDMAVFNS